MRLRCTWRRIAGFYWRPLLIALGFLAGGAVSLALAPSATAPTLEGTGYFAGIGLTLVGAYVVVALLHGVLIYRGYSDLLTVTTKVGRDKVRRRQSGLYFSRKAFFVEDASVSAYVEREQAPRGSRMTEVILSSGDESFRLLTYLESSELLAQLGAYLGEQGIELVQADVAPARDTAP